MITVLSFRPDVLQSQTTDTKLDQIELIKQFLGTWKCEGEFKTPDIMVETTTVDYKSIRTDTYTRVK